MNFILLYQLLTIHVQCLNWQTKTSEAYINTLASYYIRILLSMHGRDLADLSWYCFLNYSLLTPILVAFALGV